MISRRAVIRQMLVLSGGSAVLAGCDLSSLPEYSNLPLRKKQRSQITTLSKVILPDGEETISTLESTTDFILTMINDCYSEERIEKFLVGMEEFETMIQESVGKSLIQYDDEDKRKLFSLIDTEGELSENAQEYYQSVRRLSIQHLTSSEYFMTEHLNYEFVPGRFNGCHPV